MVIGHVTNDFCRSCRDKKEDKTSRIRLLGSWLALYQKRKKRLGAYYTDDLGDSSEIDIDSLSPFKFLEALSGTRTRV